MGSDDPIPPFIRRSLEPEHRQTAVGLLRPYYSDAERLERAVEKAVEGTLEAFRRRANGRTDEAGQQQETMDAIYAAVEAVPPDQPVELVKKKLRLRVQKIYGERS